MTETHKPDEAPVPSLSAAHTMKQKKPKASKKKAGRISRVTIVAPGAYRMMRWKDLTLKQRLLEVIRYAYLSGGSAVTVNCSTEYESILLRSENPTRMVSKRINSFLNRVGVEDLPILMVLEVASDTKRLHMHGVFVPSEHDSNVIADCLRDAAGRISGKSGSRQYKGEKLFNAEGWFNYISRDMAKTRRYLELKRNNELVWVSHALTKPARAHYERIRLGKIRAANNNQTMALPAS